MIYGRVLFAQAQNSALTRDGAVNEQVREKAPELVRGMFHITTYLAAMEI